MIINATARFTARGPGGQFVRQLVTPAVIESVTNSAESVLARAKDLVPVRTGELKASGKTVIQEGPNSVTGHIVFDANHAGYVEYGTGVRGAESAGSGPYDYDLSWMGMPAQPYLRPALEDARADIRENMAGRIALELKQ